MKAVVYLVAAAALVVAAVGAVMRGADSVRTSSGEGTVSQETLADSFTDSYLDYGSYGSATSDGE